MNSAMPALFSLSRSAIIAPASKPSARRPASRAAVPDCQMIAS